MLYSYCRKGRFGLLLLDFSPQLKVICLLKQSELRLHLSQGLNSQIPRGTPAVCCLAFRSGGCLWDHWSQWVWGSNSICTTIIFSLLTDLSWCEVPIPSVQQSFLHWSPVSVGVRFQCHLHNNNFYTEEILQVKTTLITLKFGHNLMKFSSRYYLGTLLREVYKHSMAWEMLPVMLASFSLMRILGECSASHFPPRLSFFCFKCRLARTQCQDQSTLAKWAEMTVDESSLKNVIQ